MKSTALVCAIAAASLGFGSLSHAQGWDREGRHGSGGREGGVPQQRDARPWQGGQPRAYPPQRQFAPGQPPQHAQPQRGQPQYAQPQYVPPVRQYGPEWQNRQYRQWPHQESQQFPRQGEQYGQYGHHPRWNADAPRFRRGDFLPYEYRQRPFMVRDWRAYRLYAPPAGYQWVQTDSGDFLLIAIATGLIANMVLGQ